MSIVDISGITGGVSISFMTMASFTRPSDFNGTSVMEVVNELSQTIPKLESSGYGRTYNMLWNAVQGRKAYLIDAQNHFYTNGMDDEYEKIARYVSDALKRLDIALKVSTTLMLEAGVNPPGRERPTGKNH